VKPVHTIFSTFSAMKTILSLLLLCAALTVQGQTVTHITTPASVYGGNIYTLPQVGLVINVPITTTTYTLGRDHKCGFANFYFDEEVLEALQAISDTAYEEAVKYYKKESKYEYTEPKPYKVYSLEPLTVATKSQIDRSKVYQMSIRGADKAVKFTYDENGFLTSGSVSNNSNPVATVLNIVGKVVPLIAMWGPTNYGYSSLRKEEKDETVCPTRKRIFALLEQKEKLLLSMASYSDLTDRLTAIDQQVQSLMHRIVRVTEQTTVTSFYVLPTAVTQQPLFEYDDKANKLTISQNLNPRILSPSYNSAKVGVGSVTAENGYSLALTPLSEQSVSDYFKNQSGTDNEGLAYNVPKKMGVQIRKGTTISVNQTVDFPQFGTVGFMPQGLKKLEYTLDPNTGALREVASESKAWSNPDMIDQVSGIAKEFKKEPAPTEKELLTQEVELLELKVKKKKAETELSKE
jgi:hypothetical protein